MYGFCLHQWLYAISNLLRDVYALIYDIIIVLFVIYFALKFTYYNLSYCTYLLGELEFGEVLICCWHDATLELHRIIEHLHISDLILKLCFYVSYFDYGR